MNQLREVDDAEFEITRKKQGRGFSFIYLNGKCITDAQLKKRLKKLVIPPMWTEVMISQWADGHVQATGRDNKGRKQYIYHSEWHRQQQNEKFERLISFGKKLPSIRKKCLAQVNERGWSKNKVMSLIVLILDQTGIRIGNKRYTDENNSYGLTTLRRKHLDLDDDQLTFTYKGKSHQNRCVEIDDPKLIKYIQQSAEQPGYEIFRYQDKNRDWHAADSDDVNQYIKELADKMFYSKDFRTWAASRLAVEYYPEALAEKKRSPRRKMTNILLRFVADEMGNTPTVCKDYYIHPKVMRLINDKKLPSIDDFSDSEDTHGHSASEQLLLHILL